MKLKKIMSTVIFVLLLSSCSTPTQMQSDDKTDISSYAYEYYSASYEDSVPEIELNTVQKSKSDDPREMIYQSEITDSTRFSSVYAHGMGNIYDDTKAYAVIKNEDNTYDVYQTTDSGNVWIKTQSFHLDGEPSFAFSEKNGKIIWFYNSDHDEKAHAYILSVNPKNHAFDFHEANDWFSIFGLNDENAFDVDIIDHDEYNIYITITEKGENPQILYKGYVTLSDDDLYPYSLIPYKTASYEELIDTIKINGDNQEFRKLVEKGLANVTARYEAYYIELKEPANPSKFGDKFNVVTYTTIDGGKTWKRKPEDFLEFKNKKNYHFSFENGKTLHILNGIYPPVIIEDTYFNTGKEWFSTFGLDDYEAFKVYAERLDDYTLQILIFKENSRTLENEVFFKGRVILDEDTLYPAQIIPNAKDYDSMLSTIDSDNNDFSKELSFGHANVYDNNRAYIIKFTGAGAGSIGYKKCRTEDGGKTWIDVPNENLYMENSNIQNITLEDGRIIWICNPNISYSCPSVLVFDMYTYESTENADIGTNRRFDLNVKGWFDAFNFYIPDGTTFFAEAEYKGDYIAHIRLTETVEDKKTDHILYDGDVIIDKETLLPRLKGVG